MGDGGWTAGDAIGMLEGLRALSSTEMCAADMAPKKESHRA
jgi:hypothetical protein